MGLRDHPEAASLILGGGVGLPYLGDPAHVKLDRLEGREDGFEDCV